MPSINGSETGDGGPKRFAPISTMPSCILQPFAYGHSRIVVIVSEENGAVSIAEGGHIQYDIPRDQFERTLADRFETSLTPLRHPDDHELESVRGDHPMDEQPMVAKEEVVR